MLNPKKGTGIITGVNVEIGPNATIWNYVVIGDNTKIGDGTLIGSFCDIGKNVTLGKKCNIQAHVTISNGCILGNNVFIAPNSTLLNDKYPKSTFMTPPIIKDNVVIGGGVTILPDVTIGEKVVIGGGSVVTKNVPPRTIVTGVPAKVIMTLQEYEGKRGVFINARRKVNK
ncbi:MAG: acyltransferase [Candidatus Bathyarchaeia archaeon]|jgi:acetyltransferase-like isoleucine patch superfamily enzyme